MEAKLKTLKSACYLTLKSRAKKCLARLTSAQTIQETKLRDLYRQIQCVTRYFTLPKSIHKADTPLSNVITCMGNMTTVLTGSSFAGDGLANGVDGRLDGENWKTGDVSGELLSRLDGRIRGSGLG